MKVCILADILDTDAPWSWQSAFELMDKLQEVTGTEVVPMVKNRILVGFSLEANGKILSAVEYDADIKPEELIDELGSLFIMGLSRQPAEA